MKSLWILVGGVIVFAAFIVFVSQQKKMNPGLNTTQTPNTGQTVLSPTNPPPIATTSDTKLIQQGLSLTLSAPTDGSTTKSASVTVRGKTLPGADVFVNENEMKADAQGNFSSTITLDEGENVIYVTANDVNGNYAEQGLSITYAP